MRRIAIFIVLVLSMAALGASGKIAKFKVHAQAPRSPLMVDLDFVSSNGYSVDQPFLNYYKSANPMGTTGLFTRTSSCNYAQVADSSPPFDANGYPTKLSPTGAVTTTVKTTVFQGSAFPKLGTYHVYYDGTPGAGGQLEVCGSTVSGFVDDGLGTITFTLGSAAAVDTYYYSTSLGGNLSAPLSNFRMCYAGNTPDTTTACKNNTEYFDPTFLANVTKFSGVRPVGWGQSLNNASSTAMDYPGDFIPVTAFTWSANPYAGQPWGEVPPEVQSQLCQEGGFTYCLFTMPAEMTDAYITHWATVAHSIITNSGTTVLLEHCDEVWDPGFCSQIKNVAAPMTTFFPSCPNTNNCASTWHGYQTARLGIIWHSVWGADSSRVIAGFGSQIGNFSDTKFGLSMTAERYGGSSPTTATFTGTTPILVNLTGSNMAAGQAISFTTTGSLPTGLMITTIADTLSGSAVSFNNGSPTINWLSNGLLLNQPVYFYNTAADGSGSLPTNFTTNQIYYVVTTGTNTIQASATVGGSAIVAGSAEVGAHAGLPGPQNYYVTNDGSLGANSFHISDTLAHALAGTGQINTSGSASGTTTAYKLLWPLRVGDNIDAIDTAPYFADNAELWVDAWSADAAGMTKAFAELTAGSQKPQCTGENTTGGTSTAYTLTSDATWGGGAIPATPVNGQMIQMKMGVDNGASPYTLRVDGGNIYTLTDQKGVALSTLNPDTGGPKLPAGICVVFVFTNATASGAVTATWRFTATEPATGGVIATVGTFWASDYRVANDWRLKLFAYEGGEALTDFLNGDADIETMYTAMIQDSRITGVYNQIYNLLRSTAPNAKPLTAYVMTRPWIAPGVALYNHWGHLQYNTDTTPLKFQAIENFR